jgi:tRNA G10  N-methylase Trm11
MPKFLILFGNTTLLSKLEFESLYPNLTLEPLEDQLFAFESEANLVEEMLDVLGGTVKIFTVIKELANTLTNEELVEEVVAILLSQSSDPYFTFSQIGKGQREISNADIKDLIKENGKKARYFSAELSESALLSHHSNATEILSYNHQASDKLLLAQVKAVQDIDDWTKRDRSKPYADRKKGMLPPKVARMMVNIAFGLWQQKNQGQPLLYDPFCGTGTVLLEAGMRNLDVCGSDIDQNAVFGTRDNLEWFKQEYPKTIQTKVFYSDASHIEQSNFAKKIDLLVTEPFLGKQTPSDHELANVFRGLEKMYLGSFKSFAKVLNNGAIVAIVFPRVETPKRTYSLDGLIDKLQTKGYNLLVDPVLYAREGARVARQICLFSFSDQDNI